MGTRLRYIMCTLALGLSLSACSSAPNRQAVHPDGPPIEAASPRAAASFDAALELLRAGEWDEAKDAFILVQSEHPGDPIAQVAELYIARASLRDIGFDETGALALGAPAPEIQQAARLLEDLSGSGTVDERVKWAATLYMGIVQAAVGNPKKGFDTLAKYPAPSLSGIVLERDTLLGFAMLTEAFARAGRSADALGAAATLHDRCIEIMDVASRDPSVQPGPAERLALLAASRAFSIAPEIEEGALHTTFLRDERPLASAAAGWAILVSALDGEVGDEQRLALEEIYAVTSSALVTLGELERASELSTLMATSGGPARLVIGVVAPMTGDGAAVGQRVLKGAMLAQRAWVDGSKARVTMLALDSSDPAEQNVEALRRAGALGVVGPVDKALVPVYAPLVEAAEIPMIALSTQPLAAPVEGDEGWTFRNFISVEAEARAAARTATGRFADTRVAVLFPENGYGKLAAEVFVREAEAAGAQVVASRAYDRSAVDYTSHARAIAGAKPQAVFIPDTGAKVAELTAFLARENVWGGLHDVDPPDRKRRYVHYLGTSLWQDARLGGPAGSYIQGAVFPIWYAPTLGGPGAQEFDSAYQRAYGARPSLYGAFTYDSVNYLRQVVLDEGMRRGASARAALMRQTGFEGVTGAVRFGEGGEAERELRFVRVRGEQLDVLPAEIEAPPAPEASDAQP